jgi:hypothetical protein
MQTVHRTGERWNVVGSWRPVTKASADVPLTMCQTVADGISTGSLHHRQQHDHLPSDAHTIKPTHSHIDNERHALIIKNRILNNASCNHADQNKGSTYYGTRSI